MKTKYFLLGALLSSTIAFSQVGINTEIPKTTMDVSARRNTSGTITDNTQLIGLQAPRLTRAELAANTATYGVDQKGALVYVTDVSGGTATGQRVNINAVGYYYFDGAVWVKVGGETEPWYNVATNSQATGNAQNIFQMGKVGISTSDPKAMLHIDNTGSNAQASAMRLEGAIEVTAADITTAYRKLLINENKDVVLAPGDPQSFQLLAGFVASTDTGTNYLTAAADVSNIRRVIFNTAKYQAVAGSFDATTGIYTVNLNGFYKFDIGLLLRNFNSVGTNSQQIRLGLSLPNDTNFSNGNASFAFLTQGGNKSSDSNVPECVQVTGVIYLSAGDKVAVGVRYLNPTDWRINTEAINYRRENANYFIVTYLGTGN